MDNQKLSIEVELERIIDTTPNLEYVTNVDNDAQNHSKPERINSETKTECTDAQVDTAANQTLEKRAFTPNQSSETRRARALKRRFSSPGSAVSSCHSNYSGFAFVPEFGEPAAHPDEKEQQLPADEDIDPEDVPFADSRNSSWTVKNIDDAMS